MKLLVSQRCQGIDPRRAQRRSTGRSHYTRKEDQGSDKEIRRIMGAAAIELAGDEAPIPTARRNTAVEEVGRWWIGCVWRSDVRGRDRRESSEDQHVQSALEELDACHGRPSTLVGRRSSIRKR